MQYQQLFIFLSLNTVFFQWSHKWAWVHVRWSFIHNFSTSSWSSTYKFWFTVYAFENTNRR